MALVLPAPEELQKTGIDSLLNLLISHTELYTSLIRREGFTAKSEVFKQAIIEIQFAIDCQKKKENSN